MTHFFLKVNSFEVAVIPAGSIALYRNHFPGWAENDFL
jgi:hypothetical protein